MKATKILDRIDAALAAYYAELDAQATDPEVIDALNLHGEAVCHDCGAPLERGSKIAWRHLDIGTAREQCSYASFNAPRPYDPEYDGRPIMRGHAADLAIARKTGIAREHATTGTYIARSNPDAWS